MGFRPPAWRTAMLPSKAGPVMKVVVWGWDDALASCWCPSPRNI